MSKEHQKEATTGEVGNMTYPCDKVCDTELLSPQTEFTVEIEIQMN
jgi:hypothetical protein